MLTRRQCLVLLSAVAVLLLVGFLPTFGPPHFRYNGSDPNHHVWNLGWPAATLIIDTESSPHLFVGPCFFLWVPLFVFLVLGLAVSMLVWNYSSVLCLVLFMLVRKYGPSSRAAPRQG